MRKKLIQFIIVFIIICLILILNIPNSTADWPTFRHDNLNSGFTESESPYINQLNWTLKINSHYFKEELILISTDNLIFSDGIYLKCLSAKNLTLKWKYHKKDSYTGTGMAISGDKLYFSDGPSYLKRSVYCLDIKNGVEVWSFPAEFAIKAPSVRGNNLFFGGSSGLYCLNKNTGELIWKYTTEHSSIFNSPPVMNGKVICAYKEFEAFEDDIWWIYCLNENTGEKIWTFRVLEDILSPITIHNEKIYFGSRHYLRCLKLDDGNLIWKFKTNSLVTSAPAVHEERVFFGDWDNNIYCLNSENGNLLWSKKTGGWEKISPTISDEKVFLGSDGGFLYAFNEKNGTLLWKYNTGHPIQSSPIINDGSLYVISGERLFCFSKGHENEKQDLFINDYDLSFSPGWVDEGIKDTVVTITAKVHNMGKMNGNKYRNFTIGFYELNGNVSKLIDRRNKTISDNGLNSAKVTLKVKVEKEKQILVKIEDTNFIEQNLTNNEANIIIKVYEDYEDRMIPESILPFCAIFLFSIIIIFIIILFVVIFPRNKRPFCLKCKNVLILIPYYNIWYCSICKKYFTIKDKNVKRKKKQVKKQELKEINIQKVISPTPAISKQSVTKPEIMSQTTTISKQSIKKSKSPYSCPTCDNTMFYIPWYGRWYCYRCGRYV